MIENKLSKVSFPDQSGLPMDKLTFDTCYASVNIRPFIKLRYSKHINKFLRVSSIEPTPIHQMIIHKDFRSISMLRYR